MPLPTYSPPPGAVPDDVRAGARAVRLGLSVVAAGLDRLEDDFAAAYTRACLSVVGAYICASSDRCPADSPDHDPVDFAVEAVRCAAVDAVRAAFIRASELFDLDRAFLDLDGGVVWLELRDVPGAQLSLSVTDASTSSVPGAFAALCLDGWIVAESNTDTCDPRGFTLASLIDGVAAGHASALAELSALDSVWVDRLRAAGAE